MVYGSSSDGGKTILIVEDDELVRTAVKSLLESLGYRVLSAGNGREALEILSQPVPIDLLFTDVVMPGGMHGPQLVAEARRLRPELKFLYTSGYQDYPGVHQGPDPGIVQHPGIVLLSKPYEPYQLADKLRDILDS
jgi:CheY-like chemotaxis protein